MELDVHLIREAEEPWGLELIGGRDQGTPLTISQVYPSSPAQAAGLQCGDTVTRLGDHRAAELSAEDAACMLAETRGLGVGVCRGLYDPVLDDFEAIYEPIERDDSDLRSEPTEVSPPRYVEFPEHPITDLDFRPITESRSLTASPFVPQTKPFRPFSTEPLKVPPLEDPIILNPKFKDDFAELLESIGVDIDKVETKFKLPVSENYDPDYKKKVDGIIEKSAEREINGRVTETKEVRFDEIVTEIKDISDVKSKEQNLDVLIKDDNAFDAEMKLEIDMEGIEKTAIDVVEESIERAVSVTEEIKEAIEEELRTSATREIVEVNAVQELTSSEIKEVTEDLKHVSTNTNKNEEFSTEINQTESNGLCMKTRKESEIKESKVETTETSKLEVKSQNHVINEPSEEIIYVCENKQNEKTREVKTNMTEFARKEFEETKENKKEGQQKAFSIGLQTIPNIRGMAQSSYHFDLLMRTFFIHLTDVMVAMSRFILTQPAVELESKAEKIFKDKLIVGLRSDESDQCNINIKSRTNETVQHDIKTQSCTAKTSQDIRKDVEVTQKVDTTTETKRSKQEHISQIKNEITVQDQADIEMEEIERKRISGAEMAQRTQKKSKDLTNKMEAVITEFETKTGIEDISGRRSRSRSQIKEEVMCESKPLECLDKFSKQTQETTSITSETRECKKSEHEYAETKSKTKSGKQMYVAVVESHVYTNKDAILRQTSETSSIDSAEEITTKKQAVEVITQALDDSSIIVEEAVSNKYKQEVSVVKEAAKPAILKNEDVNLAAVTISEVAVEGLNEIQECLLAKTEATETKQESLTTVASETTELVDDLRSKTLKVTEASEKTAIVAAEENFKTAVIQTAESVLEESGVVEMTNSNIKEKHASSNVLQHAIAVAESTDIIIDDSKIETIKAEELNTKTVTVRSEESFKTAAIEIEEVILEEAVEQHANKLVTKQATVRETSNLSVAGIIDTKIEEDKVIVPKPAEDEYASLKIIKGEVIDDNTVDITEITESELYQKSIDIENSYIVSENTSVTKEKLHIRTDIAQSLSHSSSDENNNIDTPTPSTVPPTPLTDEYVFNLEIPLPKLTGPVILEEPDHEDLNIVKKKLIPHIETTIEDPIIYDPPLPTPPVVDTDTEPSYNKPGLNGGMKYNRPGLKGGDNVTSCRKEYIREIERKSSLLASAIDETIKCIEEYKEEVGIDKVEPPPVIEEVEEPKPEDELVGFKSVPFSLENVPRIAPAIVPVMPAVPNPEPYLSESGEPLGGVQGIVDGLEDATVDDEVAKELGKPGLTEDKIAELISGESEMLREAHVMGLTRVLSTHMNKPDDSSVDFNKLKPINPSLKNSEVIAALNAEILKSSEDRKKDDKKWTTFLQKPQRPAPRAKCGYYGYLPQKENDEGPYKVKIVKQPKPKVAPDYKAEDFETGPLPWESRALAEPSPPPVEAEEPILVPEDGPEFIEAVDPLLESQVPDLQDTGIVLPPPKPDTPETPPNTEERETSEEEDTQEEDKEVEQKEIEEKPEMKGEVEEMADQLVQNVKSMVDPNAPIQQQLSQMRAQLAALAQLPCVIQQSLEILTNHLASISTQQETHQVSVTESQNIEELKVAEAESEDQIEEISDVGHVTIEEIGAPELDENTIQDVLPDAKITLTAEEYAALKREEEMLLEEQIRAEKLKKVQEKIDQESRQLKQRSAPRVGKPKMFGPQNPEVRPLVLPGGRRWKGPKDVFNDQFIAETLASQSEVIQGKVMGQVEVENACIVKKNAGPSKAPIENNENFFNQPPVALEKESLTVPAIESAVLVEYQQCDNLKKNHEGEWEIVKDEEPANPRERFESDRLPYDERINFMKYEKPPVNLDHLQNSDVYKAVHGMDAPVRRVDLLTPVVAEADYRERCRSATPSARQEQHLDLPQQLQP